MKGLILLFLLSIFCRPIFSQTYVCPGPNFAGIPACSLVNGCVVYSGVNQVCGDYSHYYVDNLDGGAFGYRTYSYLTLPLDDYIFLLGILPLTYAYVRLRKNSSRI